MNNIPSLVYGHAGIPLINPLDKNIIPFSNIDEKQHAPFGLKNPHQNNITNWDQLINHTVGIIVIKIKHFTVCV